ncbi:phage tail protein [Pseudomonas fulva]|uniref:phage tail-collar fiber domain-containing protein n=1 Tax=Pseudomonas fulva TaxID=47880 RepID=UPI0034619056
MSTPLQPVITKAGLGAVWNETNTGLSAQITHVVLGTAGYTPSNSQKSLRAQVAKYPVAGGERLSDTLIHLTALADGDAEFWVREIGFVLADGTLLAVWSHPTEILTYKASGTDLLLAYDLSLSALPADSVTIVSSAAGLNLTLAAPLAAMASALLGEQLRGLLQRDEIDALARQQQVSSERAARLIEQLTDRMGAVEQRQVDDHDGLLSMGISAAEALVSEQKRGLERQDQLTELSRRQTSNNDRLALHGERLAAAEQQHATDHEGVRSMGISAAEAILSTQTQLTKHINGA